MMSWLMASALFAATALAQSGEEPRDPPADDPDPSTSEAEGGEGSLALPFDAPRPAPPPTAAPPPPERPLAIPGGRRPPPGIAPPPPPPPPIAEGVTDAAKLQALRQYRRERLEVRPEVEVSGGGSRVQTGIGFGGPYWGSTVMVTDPIRTTRTWGVYQGSERLDVPAFLAATEQLDLKRQIEQDIVRSDRRGRTLLTVGGVGLATAVVGTIGARTAPPYSLQEAQFASVIFPGLVVGTGGLILGSVPAGRAERLQYYPAEALDISEAQRLADEHNERLRVRLGLSAEDVWSLEAERAP